MHKYYFKSTIIPCNESIVSIFNDTVIVLTWQSQTFVYSLTSFPTDSIYLISLFSYKLYNVSS